MHAKRAWVSPSVREMAGGEDPVTAVTGRAQGLALEALDQGWDGPPYNPVHLAKINDIRVVPSEDVLDAKLVSAGGGAPVIEYNPNMPDTRIRFSIAHEIAHTLFPDYAKETRHRLAQRVTEAEREIEFLCNVAAAELLMPAVKSSVIDKIEVTMPNAIRVRNHYAVSTEAALLRMVHLTRQPVTVFAAARTPDREGAPYKAEYAVSSDAVPDMRIRPGTDMGRVRAIAECTAVGHTSRRWEGAAPWASGRIQVECIGVPPYRGGTYPRVMGIVRHRIAPRAPAIAYIVGDAAAPRGGGARIIAHIANNRSPRWGRGFGWSITEKFPDIRPVFAEWSRGGLHLGSVHIHEAGGGLVVLSMVAQEGVGPSKRPRIRYAALSECLAKLYLEAKKRDATVHMPRIGVGQAGGKWEFVSGLLHRHLVARGISVTVYDLQWDELPAPGQRLSDYMGGPEQG